MTSNRWHIYNYLKRHPEATEMVLRKQYPNVSNEELREGIKEFRSVQSKDPESVVLGREGWG